MLCTACLYNRSVLYNNSNKHIIQIFRPGHLKDTWLCPHWHYFPYITSSVRVCGRMRERKRGDNSVSKWRKTDGWSRLSSWAYWFLFIITYWKVVVPFQSRVGTGSSVSGDKGSNEASRPLPSNTRVNNVWSCVTTSYIWLQSVAKITG
jgi:hypothetical protein